MNTHRQRIFALSLLAGLSLFLLLLAASIPGLTFQAGEPFSVLKDAPFSGISTDLNLANIIEILFRVVLALSLLLIPVYIIVAIVSPDARKRLLRALLLNALIFAAFYFFRDQIAQVTEKALENVNVIMPAPDTTLATVEPTVEFNAAPPDWMVWVGSILLGLGIAAVAVFMFYLFYRWRKSQQRPPDALEEEARQALTEIQAGGDVRNAIIRCYQRMAQVLKEERAIERQYNMTPQEFINILLERGLPENSVRRLTGLFEDVRYGDMPAGEKEEVLAIACLSEIAEYCHSGRRAG